MHKFFFITLLLSTSLFSSLFAQEESEEIDYGSLAQELQYIEETAKADDQKLLENVDKISEEKVEKVEPALAEELRDVVSTKSAAVEKPSPEFQPPVQKTRRVRSR